MTILVAAREGVEMHAMGKGAYGVKVGDKGKVFHEKSASENWLDAYELFSAIHEKQKGRAGGKNAEAENNLSETG